MKLFDILSLKLPSLKPDQCKIHLACWNGTTDPLDEFLAGRFQNWQHWQSKRNFERPFIVSLIRMGGGSKWLFAGVFATQGCTFIHTPEHFEYQTKELPEVTEFAGRMTITFERSGRQSYLKAENWAPAMDVHELKPQKLTIREFPGFSNVIVAKAQLDIIVAQRIESWKSALSSVAGVYLIADRHTGRHYVGSAFGAGGIWQRWEAYSATGHGNNKNLMGLLTKHGNAYASNFQFSVLEIADTNASKDDVLARETHWKTALCSSEKHGGYNAN